MKSCFTFVNQKIYLFEDMKKIIVALALLMACSMSFAKGPFGRISAGYNNSIGLGAGINISDKVALAAELDTWTGFTGFLGGLDARFYFTDNKVKPFFDTFVGYGYLGKSYENEKCFDSAVRSMIGVNWRHLDLGGGITYDSFNKLEAVATLSFNFSLKKKN